MKANPALFEGRGERGEPKNEALLFQSTVDNHFQNAQKHKKKLRRLALCAFIANFPRYAQELLNTIRAVQSSHHCINEVSLLYNLENCANACCVFGAGD